MRQSGGLDVAVAGGALSCNGAPMAAGAIPMVKRTA